MIGTNNVKGSRLQCIALRLGDARRGCVRIQDTACCATRPSIAIVGIIFMFKVIVVIVMYMVIVVQNVVHVMCGTVVIASPM